MIESFIVNLVQILKMLRWHFLVAVVVGSIVGGVSYSVEKMKIDELPKYTVKSELVITRKDGEPGAWGVDQINTIQQLMISDSILKKVSEGVLKSQNYKEIEMIRDALVVTKTTGSRVLSIEVSLKDKKMSRDVSKLLMQQTQKKVNQLAKNNNVVKIGSSPIWYKNTRSHKDLLLAGVGFVAGFLLWATGALSWVIYKTRYK
ncbi:hypothetical protein [Weissella cibaria]|uniref:hypothetical protein n=1 Tax=Weissella cibaria TaxID=137591 RepID=UPI00215A6766|nr:hypothetical protein [Weissella cibaria]MCR8702359.1 hypothetical protein [Weissella cibaria]